MALQRPTLSTLRDRAIGDVKASLRLSGPLGAYLTALAHAVAGAAHGLYGYIEYIGRQMTPATAEGYWLEQWASLWQYTRKPAATAGGDIALTGQAGATVPDALYFQSGEGIVYASTAGGVLDGSGTLTVPALSDLPGEQGNLAAGTSLTLVSPAAGIDSAATVASDGITGGRNTESDDELRDRLIKRLTNPPHGGNKADYELWALAVPGITRAWCMPRYAGDGSVRVYVGEAEPAGPKLASATLIAAALANIQAHKPVSYSDLDVDAPTITATDITLNVTPDTAAIREAVELELNALFERDAEPEGKILISRINESISIAVGEGDHTVVTPTADVTAATGQILTLGTVTFT